MSKTTAILIIAVLNLLAIGFVAYAIITRTYALGIFTLGALILAEAISFGVAEYADL